MPALRSMVQKTCIVGDSHIRRIKTNLFNSSINESRASEATINKLDHFITPIMEEDQPDTVIIHLGPNDITYTTISNVDAEGISKCSIHIGKKC